MKQREGPKNSERRSWSERIESAIYSSVIAHAFRRMINWLYSLLINGFFARIFTAYKEEEQGFENGLLTSLFYKPTGTQGVVGRVKWGVAKAFENSLILNFISDFVSSLLHRRLKTYGAFFLPLGAYGIVTYLIREYVVGKRTGRTVDVIFYVFFLLFAVLLMTSKETLGKALLNSKWAGKTLFSGMGLQKDHFSVETVLPKQYSGAAILGLILGGLTYFISPVYYVIAAALLFLISLIFYYPEIGVLVLLAALPLSFVLSRPTVALLVLLGVTTLGYLVKLVRGKRVFKLRLLDFFVLLFGLLLLFGSVFSAGGVASLRSGLVYVALLFGYFLTVNLIRTKAWVKRCVTSLVLGGVASAVVGVFQLFVGNMEASWIDSARFSDIQTRITGTFENPNIYASYLLLIIPFVFALLMKKVRISQKLLLLSLLGLFSFCLVETWSRGAWLGCLITSILFFLVCTRRSVAYMLFGCAALPAVSFLIPDNVLARFASIGSASDTSSLYRISAWKGVGVMLKEHWIGGIGVGESAFSAVYPAFAYAGVEGIHHSHSLYLQIFSELGIAGILVFLCVTFMFVQKCLGHVQMLRTEQNSEFVVAGLMAVMSFMIMGLTDYTWYSYRAFLQFWLIVGLTCAAVHVGEYESRQKTVYKADTEYAVALDLNIDNL